MWNADCGIIKSKISNPKTEITKWDGFTLIELIIVLFIIGIVSGLVGMMVSRGTGSLETRTFTKDVSAVLRYARNHAVSEKKIYCFVIDRDEQMLRLYAETPDYKKIDLVTDKVIPEELEIKVQGNDEEAQYIEFFPQGHSSGGVVEIINEKGTVYFIAVNRISGKLEVEKEE